MVRQMVFSKLGSNVFKDETVGTKLGASAESRWPQTDAIPMEVIKILRQNEINLIGICDWSQAEWKICNPQIIFTFHRYFLVTMQVFKFSLSRRSFQGDPICGFLDFKADGGWRGIALLPGPYRESTGRHTINPKSEIMACLSPRFVRQSPSFPEGRIPPYR